MHVYAGLLRGINVGGRSLLRMDALRRVAGSLGFEEVRTFLQSGNLVFGVERRTARSLETALEAALLQETGREIRVMVRDEKQLASAIARNPFPDAAADDPSHTLVYFLSGKPARAGLSALTAAIVGPEKVHLIGTELFVDYSGAIGTSKLTGALIERKLGVAGTARNWNTVTRLMDMLTATKER